MPPADWVNDQLKSLGEEWTVSPEKPDIREAVPIRSYLSFDGGPRFAGSAGAAPGTVAPDGTNFQAGDPLGFNIHFKASGPNQIKLGNLAKVLLIEPDSEPATQKSAITLFLQEYSSEHRKWLKQNPKASEFPQTLMPGDAQFTTVLAWTGDPDKTRITTQDDLDKLRSGADVAFVMSVLPYPRSWSLAPSAPMRMASTTSSSPRCLAFLCWISRLRLSSPRLSDLDYLRRASRYISDSDRRDVY